MYENLQNARIFMIFARKNISPIGAGAQSTLEARHYCPKNMPEKLTKCPNFI